MKREHTKRFLNKITDAEIRTCQRNKKYAITAYRFAPFVNRLLILLLAFCFVELDCRRYDIKYK